MENKVEEIIKKLVYIRTDESLFNPYNQVDKKYDLNTAPGLRQNNLRVYFDAYQNNNVKEIWFTEFIDPTSTKLSGVPLIAPIHFSRIQNILQLSGLFEIPVKNSMVASERKLNAVWSEIESYTIKPMLWSVIPFCPEENFDKNIKYENELKKYSEFLYLIMDIFKPASVYTLSKKAQKSLSFLNVKSKYRAVSGQS